MAAPISTTWTQAERDDIARRVFREVAAGRAVTTILKTDDAMPDRSTFWDWLRKDQQLADELARARDCGIEAALEDAQAIADGDDVISLDGLSGDALAAAMARNDPKRARLRYDARIKRAQMLKPKTYGPRLDLTTDGKQLGSAAPDAADRAAELLKRVEARVQGGADVQDLLS
ncbi:MAG TPA: hypothetical protein VF638_14240 [Sphingomonas sp.]|jgi:hypothetical protein